MIEYNLLASFRAFQEVFLILWHNNSPKRAILRVKKGAKMLKLPSRKTRQLEKYLEFLQSEKSVEQRKSPSIQIQQLHFFGPDPPPCTLNKEVYQVEMLSPVPNVYSCNSTSLTCMSYVNSATHSQQFSILNCCLCCRTIDTTAVITNVFDIINNKHTSYQWPWDYFLPLSSLNIHQIHQIKKNFKSFMGLVPEVFQQNPRNAK